MTRPRPSALVTFVTLALMLGAGALGPLARQCHAATPFAPELVDAPFDTGRYSSLVLDEAGNPHIAYYDASNQWLRYAFKEGGVWTTETVDFGPNVGQYCALALDAQGNPHISYYDAASADLRYATKSGMLWTIEVVDATGSVGTATSIAVDAKGNPHISYDGASVLKYATKDAGFWTITSLWFSFIDATSIKLDSEGYPRIAFHDANGRDLDYAWKSAGGWSSTILQNGGGQFFTDYGIGVSLALDARDTPHLSYAGSFGLWYATAATGLWTFDAMDTTNLSNTSIAIDPQGTPHIAYYTTNGDYNLNYISKTVVGWSKEVVDYTGDVGAYASLAMNAQGNPSIAYYDASNGDLKYSDAAIHLLAPLGGERWDVGSPQTVRWSGAGPVDIQMSGDGGFAYFTVLPAVSGGTATIQAPALNTATAKLRLVRFATFSTSASPGDIQVAPGLLSPWWTSTVDNTPLAGNHTTSLKVDVNGNPRISYQDDTNGRLKYASKSGGVWTIEDVAATGVTGAFTGQPFTSLALNAQGNPLIAYFDITNKHLRLASKTGGVWSTEVVDNSGNADQFCSLALDAQGNPRISYLNATNGVLRYASRNGGVWTLENADQSALLYVGAYNSLALDALGNPHIAYEDVTTLNLRYATKSGGAWALETIFPAGRPGPTSISIGLDPQGNPHISYYDGARSSLMYASKSGASWGIETVGAGNFPSLRLDAEGRPHIAYVDIPHASLMHAWKSGSIWAREVAAVGTGGSGLGPVFGQYNSIALDTYMNPRISFYDGEKSILKYASSAIEGIAPVAGTTWPVGAARSVDWSGTGRTDIYLSTDGGVTWLPKEGQATGGHFTFTVPHTPSRFCKIGLTRGIPYSIAVTDSFFTIQTSVQLLALLAAPVPNGGHGMIVTWSTDPGPADLAGYRLERASASTAWQTIAPLTRETSFTDAEGSPGARYRLFAVNRLGEEILLGETTPRSLAPLAAWPIPFRGGSLTIAFATAGGLGGAQTRGEVSLFDVQGRLVRRITRGVYGAGYQTATWDGRDDRGRDVGAGVYFLLSRGGGHAERMRVVVLR